MNAHPSRHDKILTYHTIIWHDLCMHSAEVARILGVSRQRMYQLDDQLRPARDARGRRVYDLAAVEEFVAARAAARAGVAR